MVSHTLRFFSHPRSQFFVNYGKKNGGRFQKLAFGYYDMDEADAHETLLKEQNIDYLRIDS